jgi:phage terminase large subunit-like protein
LSLSENVSPAELLASLPPERLATFLKRTSDRELEAIEHDWGWWGRRNQQAPKGDWRTWLLLAGRGFGKTRS